MGNAPKEIREDGIDDFPVSAKQQLLHLDRRLLGVPPRPVGVLFGWKIGFKDRFQHQQRCCHADPIPHARDAQRPEVAVGLRYIHSSDWLRPVEVSCLSASASSASHRSTPYASISAKSWPSIPGAPLLERHW